MLLAASLALAGPLTVRLTDVVPDGAPLKVAIFSSSQAFPTLEEAVRSVTVPASATSLEVALGEVPAGTWAVAVLHDQNRNGSLDFRWLPPGPAEGTSASCPSRPWAMPTWGACSFVVDQAAREVSLVMWY